MMKSSGLVTTLLYLTLAFTYTSIVAGGCIVACEGDCTDKPGKVYMYELNPAQQSAGGQWSQMDSDNGYMAHAQLTNNVLTLAQVRLPATNPIVPATYLFQLIYQNGVPPQFWYLNAGDQCTADLPKGIEGVHLWVALP